MSRSPPPVPYRIGSAKDLKGCPVCNELCQQPPELAEGLRAVLGNVPAAAILGIIGHALMIEAGPSRDAVAMFIDTEIPPVIDRLRALVDKIV